MQRALNGGPGVIRVEPQTTTDHMKARQAVRPSETLPSVIEATKLLCWIIGALKPAKAIILRLINCTLSRIA